MKKVLFVGVLVALLVPAIALACPPQPKVTLCHSTMSPTNPFVMITVAADAVFKQGHDQHHNKADIIPPFTYWVNERDPQCGCQNGHWERRGWFNWVYVCDKYKKCDIQKSYPGLNMGTIYGAGFTGAEVLANGCEIPEPPYETCDETTDWVLVNTEEVTKPNGNVVIKYFYEKYDERDQEAVCDSMVAVDRIPYDVCAIGGETYEVAGPWSEWVYKDGKEHRSRTITVYDAVRDEICTTYTETESRCKDLFRMWLLWDEMGRECYIISETHPSVDRQKVLCFPCAEDEFVSVRSWSGMVDSCDNWELDKYRGFERLHGQDLRDVWQRHLNNGPRCNVDCK